MSVAVSGASLTWFSKIVFWNAGKTSCFNNAKKDRQKAWFLFVKYASFSACDSLPTNIPQAVRRRRRAWAYPSATTAPPPGQWSFGRTLAVMWGYFGTEFCESAFNVPYEAYSCSALISGIRRTVPTILFFSWQNKWPQAIKALLPL